MNLQNDFKNGDAAIWAAISNLTLELLQTRNNLALTQNDLAVTKTDLTQALATLANFTSLASTSSSTSNLGTCSGNTSSLATAVFPDCPVGFAPSGSSTPTCPGANKYFPTVFDCQGKLFCAMYQLMPLPSRQVQLRTPESKFTLMMTFPPAVLCPIGSRVIKWTAFTSDKLSSISSITAAPTWQVRATTIGWAAHSCARVVEKRLGFRRENGSFEASVAMAARMDTETITAVWARGQQAGAPEIRSD